MELIDRVIEQIISDLIQDDTTAIVELLQSVPEENLKAFLSDVIPVKLVK